MYPPGNCRYSGKDIQSFVSLILDGDGRLIGFELGVNSLYFNVLMLQIVGKLVVFDKILQSLELTCHVIFVQSCLRNTFKGILILRIVQLNQLGQSHLEMGNSILL